MAGRPVAVSSAPSGLLYGMIAFAIISVAALGLFIFQLTKNKEAENRARSAQARLTKYGSPPAYYDDEAAARRSKTFAVMADDIEHLSLLVTGATGGVARTISAQAGLLLSDIAARKPDLINTGDTLLSAIGKLDQAHAVVQEDADALAIVVEDLEGERVSLTGQLKSTRGEFEAEVANLSQQLQQAQEEKIAALEQKDGQLRELQAAYEASEQRIQTDKREGNALVREKDIEIGKLENLVAVLQKQIQDLKPGSFDPSAILTKADGRVLRAIPGSNIVYINLGALDQIKVGMGFEVYSQTREVRSTLRGKASLEVVTVMEDTAECRVMRRTRGRPIIEKDIVVNIAYERQRKPKFVIRGDFDLDYDGQVDFEGAAQIASIVRQWGGQVVDELDESVDFVVVGLAPKAPTFAADAVISDVVRDQAYQRALDESRFRNLISRAQKTYIPVITQNMFLFLTGYAGDAAVR